jgi:hypothetical protein
MGEFELLYGGIEYFHRVTRFEGSGEIAIHHTSWVFEVFLNIRNGQNRDTMEMIHILKK